MTQALKIPLEPVESSNIAAIGYDAARSILAVQFKGKGDIYHYAAVPVPVAQRLYGAPSIGRFYTDEIKGKFTGQRMTGPCVKCGDTGWDGERCTDCGCADYAVPPLPVRHAFSQDSIGTKTRRALCGSLADLKTFARDANSVTCADCLKVQAEQEAMSEEAF